MSVTEQVADASSTPVVEQQGHVGEKHPLSANEGDVDASRHAKKHKSSSDAVDQDVTDSRSTHEEQNQQVHENGSSAAPTPQVDDHTTTNGTSSSANGTLPTSTSGSEPTSNGHSHAATKTNGSSVPAAEEEDGHSHATKTNGSSVPAVAEEEDAEQATHPTTASKEPVAIGDEQYLEHPEKWATGDEPATRKQKDFIAVLETKTGDESVNGVNDSETLSKAEASVKIQELKSQQA